ncbi:MAG: hypothetical protein ACE5NC_06980 [Anaerolineae bacterium]
MTTFDRGAPIRGWRSALSRLSDDVPLRTGLLAGIAGVILSLALRGVVPGRYLGDPLPLALAVTGILRGFAYFDWRAPLLHAAFAASLGASAGLLVRMGSGSRAFPDGAARAGRIAGVVSVFVVVLLEVDALSVALWYALGGFVSVALSSYAGRLAARMLVSSSRQQ